MSTRRPWQEPLSPEAMAWLIEQFAIIEAKYGWMKEPHDGPGRRRNWWNTRA